jgi:hypothetical protein
MMRLCTVFIPCKLLYVFRVITSPIIRSANKLYLQHLALTEPYTTFRLLTPQRQRKVAYGFDQCQML